MDLDLLSEYRCEKVSKAEMRRYFTDTWRDKGSYGGDVKVTETELTHF